MADLEIDWIDEAFPDDAAELLIDQDSDDDDEEMIPQQMNPSIAQVLMKRIK